MGSWTTSESCVARGHQGKGERSSVRRGISDPGLGKEGRMVYFRRFVGCKVFSELDGLSLNGNGERDTGREIISSFDTLVIYSICTPGLFNDLVDTES